ncbi:MAG TPA: FG-GAP-like repeat-containing protein [Syntrophales bacterium]|nr:FG-GAP-like repeat-containing protein [Syntrophales bacterium]HOU76517.1 FG-GAP-like repeat-containing protein [Syntrophales bacterium]HPC32460.1 FG-GAP-like repeat-containing protein [Syntrophales bacterium]HQG33853.1 FG-GAP-like repeat-containing protein [Syntrophales bacterium]HQI35151.1 FG-GAP-like repeat-containing protein [Syntrophales bacterium]
MRRFSNKRFLMFAGALLLFLLIAAPLKAKDKKTVAVLPFAVNSAENIDYVQQGIQDMLSTRIAATDKIVVLGRDTVDPVVKTVKLKEMTPADVYALGKKLAVDYVVAGTITKIGNSVSIDGKLVDIDAKKQTVSIATQSQGMDDVIVKVNDFAQRIEQHISGTAPPASGPLPAVTAPAAALPQISAPGSAPTQKGREDIIIAGMRTGKKATFTGAINPDFISGSQPRDKKGFWMSQKYPTNYRGLDVGDVNGDGLNEIVVIDDTNVFVYQKKGNDAVLLAKISGGNYNKYVGVDIIDLNGNGIKEIIVSNVLTKRGADSISNTVSSFVLEWKDNKFITIANNLPWLFRVINTNPAGVRALGQKIGVSRPFETDIYEMVWRNGKYDEGTKLKIPRGLNIYGLTLDNLGEGAEKIIAFNDYDYLCVYQETDKPLYAVQSMTGSREFIYKSEDVFGGSNMYIESYGEDIPGNDYTFYNTYMNTRIIPYDTNKDGKRELIVVKNLTPSRILKNVKVFTASEFYNLEWDSMGLVENWRTRKMNGYVADYQIKDIDNDGQDEIVMALVTSAGSLVGRESVIAAYKIHAQ